MNGESVQLTVQDFSRYSADELSGTIRENPHVTWIQCIPFNRNPDQGKRHVLQSNPAQKLEFIIDNRIKVAQTDENREQFGKDVITEIVKDIMSRIPRQPVPDQLTRMGSERFSRFLSSTLKRNLALELYVYLF